MSRASVDVEAYGYDVHNPADAAATLSVSCTTGAEGARDALEAQLAKIYGQPSHARILCQEHMMHGGGL
jgi:hypothetical protein